MVVVEKKEIKIMDLEVIGEEGKPARLAENMQGRRLPRKEEGINREIQKLGI